jgi:acyl-CoA thioesterase-1
MMTIRQTVAVLAVVATAMVAAPRETAAQSESPAVQVDPRPVILAVGESTTEGYGVRRDLSYPAQLQKELDKRGYHYRVVNHGVSGSTTFDALLRFDRGLALRPKIVLIALGGNDGGNRVPPEATRANLTKMMSLFKRAGAEVFLFDRNIRGTEGMFAELAKEQHAILLPPLTTGVAGNPDLLIGDQSHPNAEGYTIIVANLLKDLEPYLQKQQLAQEQTRK